MAVVAPLIFVAPSFPLASPVLGTRHRSSWGFSGVAAAFVVHVILAVAVGALLSLLPHRPREGVVVAVFLLGAVLLLRGREERRPSRTGPPTSVSGGWPRRRSW